MIMISFVAVIAELFGPENISRLRQRLKKMWKSADHQTLVAR
jgi:hypothetical protein